MKRYNYRYRRVQKLVLALLSLILFACESERIIDTEDNNYKLTFSVDTRTLIGGTQDGVMLSSIRVILLDTKLGDVVIANRLITGSDDDSGYIFSVRKGDYKICVVANETIGMTPSLNLARTFADISAIRVPVQDTEASLVLYNELDIQLQASSTDPGQARVSIDGGQSWIAPTVPIKLDKVASKISLAIIKKTAVAEDRFTVKKVELANLPGYSYLTPKQAYTEMLGSKIPFEGNSVSFDTNNDSKTIFEHFILPEYILYNPGATYQAATLLITVDYKNAFSTREITYTVPVLGLSASDYSLQRNCHYNVTATITRSGDTENSLYIEYVVSNWDIAGDGQIETGEMSFSGAWSDGLDEENLVYVANNTSVGYEFALNSPPGAKWTAQLTNFLDFDFDLTGSGVREGVTNPDETYIIKIRPKGAVFTNDVTTEFYITVDNGTENIEIDLSGKGTGRGNRFIVKQIPN